MLALVIPATCVGGFFYWLYETPRASGPPSQALFERFDPTEGQQVVNDILAAHMDVTGAVAEQRTVLESNGFDCAISLVKETKAQMLTCRRPIEGRRYCDCINYLAYETASAAITQTLGVIAPVRNRNRVLGRCLYTEPSPED